MKSSRKVKRRDFLRYSGGSAASIALAGCSRVSPSQEVVVAVIGCGVIGNHHLKNLLSRKDVEVAALCDVKASRFQKAQESAGPSCQGYQDYRYILDRDDIDAIWVATPDHWHALMAVHGCQAGKDVYVEKPLSTTVQEGRRIVEAARRYERVVQVGTQQRSMPVFQKAIDLIHSGRLGQISTARAWVWPNERRGYETPQEPPSDLDWDMWLGPAPWVPYSPERFEDFRAFDDYAGGELTNWGPHLVDVALWGMREDSPLSIQAHGGTYSHLSGSDHRTVEVVYEFKGFTLTWSQALNESRSGRPLGTMFQGTGGNLFVDRESYVVEESPAKIPGYHSAHEDFYTRVREHHDDFLNCVRTRETPAADCEVGHRSTSVCLLGNIAVDLKRCLTWDGESERFLDDEQANRQLSRPYRAPWRL